MAKAKASKAPRRITTDIVLNCSLFDPAIARPLDRSRENTLPASQREKLQERGGEYVHVHAAPGTRFVISDFDRVGEVVSADAPQGWYEKIRVHCWAHVNVPRIDEGRVTDNWIWADWEEQWTWQSAPQSARADDRPIGTYVVTDDSRSAFFKGALPLLGESVAFVRTNAATAWDKPPDEPGDCDAPDCLPCFLNTGLASIATPRDFGRLLGRVGGELVPSPTLDTRDLWLGAKLELSNPYRRAEIVGLEGGGRGVVVVAKVHAEVNSPVLIEDDDQLYMNDHWCNLSWQESWQWQPDMMPRDISKATGYVTVIEEDRPPSPFRDGLPLVGTPVACAGYVSEQDWERVYQE